MKKTIIAIVAVIGLALSASAQDAFQQHDKVINVGIGVASPWWTGSHYINKIPPISASFEYCIIDHVFDDKSGIGVGGIFGFSGANYEFDGSGSGLYGYTYRSFLLAGRGSFHYQPVRGMDTYLGLVTGYNFLSVSKYGPWQEGNQSSAEEPHFVIGGVLGIRYYFTDNFAVMAESSNEFCYLTLGVAFKF